MIYGSVTFVRNKFYDWGLLSSERFKVGTICVGNLSMGGTGKSPLTEYIVNFFKGNHGVAILSRGYKRKTSGYREVQLTSDSSEVGDEPRQFKSKFPEIKVAVCEDRCEGIQNMILNSTHIDMIILDDAYQHRKVNAGLKILLSEYSNLFYRDFVFPSGSLRESRKGAKRADAIIITKCPFTIENSEKAEIREHITRKYGGKVVFSFLKYTGFRNFQDNKVFAGDLGISEVVLFTGIANPVHLRVYLEKISAKVHFLRFPDHHSYSYDDLIRIQETFNNIATENKVIITTEKDAMRLEEPGLKELAHTLPVLIAGVEMDFFPDDKKIFNQILRDYAEYVGKNS